MPESALATEVRAAFPEMGKTPWVSEEEMWAFDRAAHELYNEILWAFGNPPAGKTVPFMPVNIGAYGSWLAEWRYWASEHHSAWDRFGHEARVEMNAFIRQFNIYRHRFTKAGGETDTAKIPVPTEGILTGVGDIVKWGAVALLAIGGIYALSALPGKGG